MVIIHLNKKGGDEYLVMCFLFCRPMGEKISGIDEPSTHQDCEGDFVLFESG